MESFCPTRLGPQTDVLSGGGGGVCADWIRTKWKLPIGVFPVSNWEFSTREGEQMSTSSIPG